MKLGSLAQARIGMLASLALLPGCVPPGSVDAASFVGLADAYVARDAEAAGAVYSEEAEVIYAYDGVPESRLEGRGAIVESFADFFGRVDPDLPIDLNFRLAASSGAEATGFYRLRFGDRETSYGRFDTLQDAEGKFVRDRSSSATLADFEEAPGPLMVRPDENNLDRSYYGLLAGRYRLPDGCDLVVTRSVVRLFVRNTCDQSWRGLNRVSGLEWTGGEQVLAENSTFRARFEPVSDKPSEALTITRGDDVITAPRATPYVTQDVTFTAQDGIALAGTLYLPSGVEQRHPATVLVHGSGPQDRDGYASIIAVMADVLANEGRAVLTYDKRGSGNSGGDGARAGFDVLASDAIAAMSFLRARDDVDAGKVGLAGSSQAGWVVAKAIELGSEPADVFLLGAAGAAFTVREQNLYNTDVRMTCAGISEPDRQMALAQQNAFFDALADPAKVAELDRLTVEASGNSAIRDWLFPGSEGLSAEDAWFTVLDPSFDPLPVWQSYRGKASMVFSEFDDSTDTSTAMRRLIHSRSEVSILPRTQHIGLEASSFCDGEIAKRLSFSNPLMELIADFAKRL